MGYKLIKGTVTEEGKPLKVWWEPLRNKYGVQHGKTVTYYTQREDAMNEYDKHNPGY